MFIKVLKLIIYSIFIILVQTKMGLSNKILFKKDLPIVKHEIDGCATKEYCEQPNLFSFGLSRTEPDSEAELRSQTQPSKAPHHMNQTWCLRPIKLDPPFNLKLVSKGPDFVELIWTADVINPACLEYNIMYWMQGISRQFNTTPLLEADRRRYRLRIDLPCPEKQYEVRVSVKIKHAKEDWSDYSSVSFLTDPGIGEVALMCKTPEEIKEVIMQKLAALRQSMRDFSRRSGL